MSAVVQPPSVKGWCPGALRPMESGDGLLVRVRITGGVVPAATLSALASLARRHGNGLVDLSQRANLQIRGVRPDTLDDLVASLDTLKLLDADPAAEAVRNVIGPPLAGLDDTAAVDGRALVRALEVQLSDVDDLHALPDKFGFLVDDGGRIPLDDIIADVRLVASAKGVTIAIGGDAATAAPIAVVGEDKAVAAAIALARAFLHLRHRFGARRMRALVADVGVEAIRAAAGVSDRATPPEPTARARPQLIGATEGFVGVGAPFGRLTAEQMDLLAAISTGEVRLTPWRLVLLPGAGAEVVGALHQAGLIVDPADPRRAVVACPGAPACSSASVDTREAAARLAPLLSGRAGVALHVSGCPKGCARPASSALTLTGRDGLYDLILDGRADSVPVRSRLDLATATSAVEDALVAVKEPR